MAVSYCFEQLDLVQGCLCVVLGTLNHLHGHKTLSPRTHTSIIHTSLKHTDTSLTDRPGEVLLDVPGQPHGGEVSPAQLADHVVPPTEQVPDTHMVVAP